MNGFTLLEPDCSEFVEVDPTGRYGRYNEVLGKGASKTVYRAFDEYEGIEVAWNQVKLYDFLQSPEDLERLYCEIHLLKTLKHRNIMKFYTSWVDTSKRNINFVTEMFTSGTLRQYRLRHRRVNIRAVKHWCRQILNGLLYLHSHDPPVIHRDLKCDNIFVNGNQGEVKIGDLGLAAILRKSHAAHCVGTPEFMAPEVYEEQYNELVDIYSFGMCILEMITFEYPYSECTHPAQIYKKVISGKRPDALYKVKDPEVRGFIEKCLATVSSRLSARELLNDPFLQIDDYDFGFGSSDYQREFYDADFLMRRPLLNHHTSSSTLFNGYCNGGEIEHYDEWGSYPQEVEATGIDLFEHHDDDEHSPDVDITIKGKMREDGSIFLRLRITDKEGRIRNIYFPFDIELDTALSVATEMVAELDITDQDVTHIADMIDGEIIKLLPDWKPGPGIVETPRYANLNLCRNCASNHTSIGSFKDYLSNNHAGHNTPFFHCCNGCGSMHGRFEEITYQADGSQNHEPETDGPLQGFTESNEVSDQHHPHQCQYQHCHESWDPQASVYLSSSGCSRASHSGDEHANVGRVATAKTKNDNKHQQQHLDNLSLTKHSTSGSFSMLDSSRCVHLDDFENDLLREMRWLRAKCLLELRDKQLKSSCVHPSREKEEGLLESDANSSYVCHSTQDSSRPSSDTQRYRNCVATIRDNPCVLLKAKTSTDGSDINKNSITASSSLLSHSLHRTTSLPVDAVHIK